MPPLLSSEQADCWPDRARHHHHHGGCGRAGVPGSLQAGVGVPGPQLLPQQQPLPVQLPAAPCPAPATPHLPGRTLSPGAGQVGDTQGSQWQLPWGDARGPRSKEVAMQEGQPWLWGSGHGFGRCGGMGVPPGSEEPAPSCGRPPGTEPPPPSCLPRLRAQLGCSGVPVGLRQPCRPMVGPTLSPTARGRGGPQQPCTSGLWKPAAAAREQLAPDREGLPWGSRQWGARPQPLCWGRRAGAGAGPDWDRLGDRGPFVWGFMVC